MITDLTSVWDRSSVVQELVWYISVVSGGIVSGRRGSSPLYDITKRSSANICTPPYLNILRVTMIRITYTTASRDGDLYGVSAWLADLFEVQRFVGGLVLSSVNGERGCIDRHLYTGRPVCVHLSIFVVETLQLQL